MKESEIRVRALSSTPVKGLRILGRRQVMLERGGIRGDRALYLIDDLGRMVNGKHLGALNTVEADLDVEDGRLTLRFPDGEVVSAEVEAGAEVQTRFFSRPRTARLVTGPFSQALSRLAGMPLRLVEPADGRSAVDRGAAGAVTLISEASLDSLAAFAGERELDARRFRMSIELSGAAAHEEDDWIGREIAVGEARIRLTGHVGRCIITSRHPETGDVDVPTLDLLRDYRGDAQTTEPLAFGVYGSVVRDGMVEVGDAVQPV